MNMKFNALSLGYAAAIIAALMMLALGVLANFGIYSGAAEKMIEAHLFFSLSFWGIAAGMIEAAAVCFVFAFIFGTVYNKLTK